MNTNEKKVIKTKEDVKQLFKKMIDDKNAWIECIRAGRSVSELDKEVLKYLSLVTYWINKLFSDTSDKMQAARNRKFKMWFHQYAGTEDFIFVFLIDSCYFCCKKRIKAERN